MAVKSFQDILAVLMEAGKLTQEQLADAQQESAKAGKSLEQAILDKKIVEDEVLARAKATVFGFPYEDLTTKKIEASVLNSIPKDIAERNHAVSFDLIDNKLSIGMTDTSDGAARQAIDFLIRSRGLRPKYFLISSTSLNHVLKRYDALTKDVSKALEVAKEKYEEPTDQPKSAKMDLEEVIKGAPVSRIVSVVLRYAVEAGASDIHIEPYGEETRVRYRIDGVLRPLLSLPKYIHASVVSRVKVLSNMKLDETRIPQDGRITETINGKFIDFRVSTLPLTESEKVVMRVLDTTKGTPKLSQLGFRQEDVDTIMREIKKPHGMFLITGPTGSGKSTTLFTILSLRNDDGVNISTLENPVEYFIKGVNQSQVRPEVGFTFAAGLRALLRQDPNIIMVGEVRDGETGELAIHAALTGHLLFSTLHTNDAMGVIPRMTDMHLEPFLLAATINISVAQRLARRICERCKAPTELPKDVADRIKRELLEMPEHFKGRFDPNGPLQVFKGRGCVRCNNTGYTGRVCVSEILVYDEEIRKLITEGFPSDKVTAALKRKGFLTLQHDALLKALEGFTTMEEVFRVTAE